ncbi:S41 family peptidase [uncultured Aquimarina sp.]|uniref:S41 family peptidase n=1 Tax=uncultured Aquimarina sp. TaxID=575652 RepID=UPI002609513F|nr:S41 family peptidase [uncultured Aquimarina sp.]
MKTKLNILIILFLVNIQLQGQSDTNLIFDKTFTSQELSEDIEVLRTGLEKLHPSLFQYIDKEEFNKSINEIKNESSNVTSYGEFYKKISSVISKIKCQHTLAVPESEVLNSINNKGKFFPLWIRWEFEPLNAFVGADLSFDANLLPGTRIISINGQTIEEIYNSLISCFSTDGNILTNKHSRLETGVEFQFWYYLLINRPENFIVKLESSDGKIFEKNLKAVTFKEWTKNHKKYRKSKNSKISAYMRYYIDYDKKNNKNPIRHEIISKKVALLKVRNFDSHKFTEIVSDAFKEFDKEKIEHLIVDVRDNGGGSDILGRYLFNYFIDKPTIYFDSLYTSTGISDTTFLFKHTNKNIEWYKYNQKLVNKMPNGRFATKPEVNEGLLVQQPNRPNFKGETYILMNGRSASTTAEFTSAMHINDLAIFIGEESGGDYHGGNGGDFATLKLPNSKIEVNIPLVDYVMNSTESEYIGRGTIPDYEIRPTMQDLLDLKDVQLEFVLNLIETKSKN